MTTKKKKKLTLCGDPKRQAVNALRGYVYQIWHSVHAWLELADEETLFLEGAEDFDIVDSEKATAVQIKNTSGNITLRSAAVIDAIVHYWQLFNAHPNRVIFFRLLTTSSIGIEKGQPFGGGVAGLELWGRCPRDPKKVEQLRNFLLTIERLPKDLRDFLSNADGKLLLQQLIQPIKWETGSRDVSCVEKAVERKLILHGEKYGIPPSKSAAAVNRLLRETLTTACYKEQQEQRFLDRALFLQLFEEETTERVSAHQFQELTKVAQIANSYLLPFLSKHAGLSFQPSPLIQTIIPPIYTSLVSRDRLIAKLGARLKNTGVLILTGSTGMGKTMLAKLVAKEDKHEWYWLNLSDQNPTKISEILRQLAVLMEQKIMPTNVVLDDLDLSSSHAHKYEDYLGGLFYTVMERNGQVIITSQKPLSTRLSRGLNLDSKSLYSAPPFDEEEIAMFAVQLGCSDDELARNWSKVILLHTRGHPQLVHAYLIHLADTQWPILNANNLFKTPPSVIHERSETRELLVEQLPEEHRELIYRLSIISGSFRRDHAIAIGEISPPIVYSGDTFDRLIGPWIESLGGEYYRVSPLLENAAEQIWSKEKIQSLHVAVGRKILYCDQLTTLEAMKILFHAWIGRDSMTLIIIISSLLKAPEKAWKSVCYNLSWLIHISLQKPPFPEDVFVNFMLRMLQFRVAVQIEPKTAALIADAWDKENTSQEQKQIFLAERLMIISQIVIYYQVEISPEKLLAFLVEIAEILKEPGEITEAFLSFEASCWVLDTEGAFDPVTNLFSFVVPRCSGVRFLDELLEGLKKTPDAVRRRMLSAFKTMDTNAQVLIDKVWLREADREKPNWPACIKVFKKTIELATQWGVFTLAIAATRAIAIVYEEYMGDISKAITILDEAGKKLGPSEVLDDERAKILFHQEQYENALAIWERMLPKWSPPPEYADTTPMFACRNAGIAAAHTGNWQKAAYFFLDGYQHAQTLNLTEFSTGFLADAGFALWKAGKYGDSIDAFVKALQNIELLPSPEKDLGSFAVRKLFGHTLLWINYMLTGISPDILAEPLPGMCSNPEINEKIRELPLTPVDLSWLQLAEIEYHLKLGSKVFKHVYSRFTQSSFPLVRFFLAKLDIKYTFRQIEFGRLPAQEIALSIAWHAISDHRAEGKEPWEEFTFPPSPDDGTFSKRMIESDLFTAALVALASAEKLDPAPFKIWRDNAKGLSGYDAIMKWIDLAEAMWSRELREVIAIMRDEHEDREVRLLAALRVTVEESVEPAALFYAHTILVSSLLQGIWAEDVAEYLAELLARQWLHKTCFRAVLLMPQLTVPDIQAACSGEVGGKQKVAKIILAASNAVSVRLSQELIRQIRNLVTNQ